MSKFDWDRVNKENALKRHEREPFYIDKNPITKKSWQKRPGKLVRCPYCQASVNEDNLTRHFQKVHGISGNAQSTTKTQAQRSQRSSTTDPPISQISLATLVVELQPRFSDLILNLARREGARINSIDSLITPVIADRIRSYFLRKVKT